MLQPVMTEVYNRIVIGKKLNKDFITEEEVLRLLFIVLNEYAGRIFK